MVGNDDLGKEPFRESPPEATASGQATDQAADQPTDQARHIDVLVTEVPPDVGPGSPQAVEAPPEALPSTGEDATTGSPGATPSAQAQTEPAEPDWKEQHDKTRNQLLRVAADFENYKKRSKRDIQDAAHRARDEILQELLPVLDNLERALEHAATAGAEDAGGLVAGVQMVLRTFQTGMDKFGVKGFDSVGQPFDPTLHEAISQRESSEMLPGSVIEEYRRGYLMGDRLLRPALVVVATAPATTPSGQGDAADSPGSPVATGATAAVVVDQAAPDARSPGTTTEEGGAPFTEPVDTELEGGTPKEDR